MSANGLFRYASPPWPPQKGLRGNRGYPCFLSIASVRTHEFAALCSSSDREARRSLDLRAATLARGLTAAFSRESRVMAVAVRAYVWGPLIDYGASLGDKRGYAGGSVSAVGTDFS